jgi:hypothetical protein
LNRNTHIGILCDVRLVFVVGVSFLELTWRQMIAGFVLLASKNHMQHHSRAPCQNRMTRREQKKEAEVHKGITLVLPIALEPLPACGPAPNSLGFAADSDPMHHAVA